MHYRNHLKKKNPIFLPTLEADLVQGDQLRGWQWWVWMLWGRRRYSRNYIDHGYLASYFFLLLLAAGGIAFFALLPFKLLGLFVCLPLNGVAIVWPIVYANRSVGLVWGGLALGLFGLASSLPLGLVLWGYSFAPILFGGYLAGGLLAVLRRYWNALIWWRLDRIMRDYYLQNGLDFEIHTQSISDYQAAYQAVCQRLYPLIERDPRFSIATCNQLRQWFDHQTVLGLDRALEVLDREGAEDV